MNKNILIVITVLIIADFVGCKNLWAPSKPQLPVVFKTEPTLEQIKTELKNRSSSIKSFSTERAELSADSVAIPLRSSTIAYESPKNLRLVAKPQFGLGPEMDMGSNDELFWFWYKRNPENELYYAKHADFTNCPLRNAFPIEPEWLIEAFGIIDFKDTDEHTGPVKTPEGNIQITSKLNTPRGQFRRVLTVAPQTAVLLKHELYSPNGVLLVGSIMSEHTVDKSTGIIYARKIELHCPAIQDKFTLKFINEPKFNSTSGFNSGAFVIPVYTGYTPTDVCSAEFQRRHAPNGVLTPPMPGEVFPNQEIQNPVGAGASNASDYQLNQLTQPSNSQGPVFDQPEMYPLSSSASASAYFR